MRWLLALMTGIGCGHGSESTGPSRDSSPGVWSRAWAPLQLEFAPVEPGILPLAVAVRAGQEVRRIGPLQQWRGSLPVAFDAGPLWVDPLGDDAGPAFYPLRVASPSGSVRLPLVPRVRLSLTVYRELIDLLQEFVAPFDGSRIRRWDHRPLTVSLPDGEWPVDYAAACEGAIDAWNLALGDTWLRAVQPGASADVQCVVLEFDHLANTQLVAADEHGHPVAMRVQLSPRWSAGSERYVRRTYLHELGHVLGLWGHSRDLEHVVNGRAVIRDGLHRDEIRAVRWLWNLPNDFDLVFLRRPPLVGPLPGRSPVTRCAAAMERGIAAIRPR